MSIVTLEDCLSLSIIIYFIIFYHMHIIYQLSMINDYRYQYQPVGVKRFYLYPFYVLHMSVLSDITIIIC